MTAETHDEPVDRTPRGKSHLLVWIVVGMVLLVVLSIVGLYVYFILTFNLPFSLGAVPDAIGEKFGLELYSGNSYTLTRDTLMATDIREAVDENRETTFRTVPSGSEIWILPDQEAEDSGWCHVEAFDETGKTSLGKGWIHFDDLGGLEQRDVDSEKIGKVLSAE